MGGEIAKFSTLSLEEKVRAYLYLGSMTQDVNFILFAMIFLCQNAINDVQDSQFDKTETDFWLSKMIVKFNTVSLLKDFVQL